MSITLPTLPPAPPASAPWADQMRYAEALQRNALVAATVELARVQEAARLVALDQVAVARLMLAELQQPPEVPPAPPAVAPAARADMVALVSTMTSAQRANPTAAAAAARAQLAAIDGA